jgi:pyruvate dehydrogenase E2 component (dihydrolipoamide acetyltransferase)
MPSLGADMDAGAVVEWRIAPGQEVSRGDIVAVVQTDKADIEIESYSSGVVEEIVVPVGQTVPVGTVLALLREVGATPAAERATEEAATASVASAAPEPVPAAAPAPRGKGRAPRRRASPRARRLAATLGTELETAVATGPGGALTGADVERAARAAAEPAADRRLARRSAIAALMARSKREIPHYYLLHHVDMTRATAWLAEENEGRSVAERLVVAALLLRAVALAARQVPDMNGFWRDDGFVATEEVRLGVAISLRDGGLVAPAIAAAEAKGPERVMRELQDLVRRARAGALRSSETDPTITVSSLGEGGVEAVFGVIYPPQVALVGFGAVLERPWAADGMIGARPVVSVTLSADHRASDGHRGARFLAEIDRLLQAPEAL